MKFILWIFGTRSKSKLKINNMEMFNSYWQNLPCNLITYKFV